MESSPSGAAVGRGSPYYMAPELFSEGGVPSFASDFWALGCTLQQLASGHVPFWSRSMSDLLNLILNSDPPPLPPLAVPSPNSALAPLIWERELPIPELEEVA